MQVGRLIRALLCLRRRQLRGRGVAGLPRRLLHQPPPCRLPRRLHGEGHDGEGVVGDEVDGLTWPGVGRVEPQHGVEPGVLPPVQAVELRHVHGEVGGELRGPHHALEPLQVRVAPPDLVGVEGVDLEAVAHLPPVEALGGVVGLALGAEASEGPVQHELGVRAVGRGRHRVVGHVRVDERGHRHAGGVAERVDGDGLVDVDLQRGVGGEVGGVARQPHGDEGVGDAADEVGAGEVDGVGRQRLLPESKLGDPLVDLRGDGRSRRQARGHGDGDVVVGEGDRRGDGRGAVLDEARHRHGEDHVGEDRGPRPGHVGQLQQHGGVQAQPLHGQVRVEGDLQVDVDARAAQQVVLRRVAEVEHGGLLALR
eukprot:768373-Hanusia_phi.AAC.20